MAISTENEQISLQLDAIQADLVTQALQLTALRSDVRMVLANQGKILAALEKENLSMAALDDQIASLTTQVAANTSATASATQTINGIGALVADGVAAAVAAGASPTQLAQLAALGTQLQASDTPLSAAILANTPAAPPPGP